MSMNDVNRVPVYGEIQQVYGQGQATDSLNDNLP